VNIFEATRSYEQWLRRQTRVIAEDLADKHELMRTSPFTFLRATFYRWLQHWPAVCPNEADAPAVLAVGDLHIENFGTWRDTEGRLVWGVNDVDEVCRLAYTQDLVRLATSTLFAVRERYLAISDRAACGAILQGYARGLVEGGRAVVLAEHHRSLREFADVALRDPVTFWRKLRALSRTRHHVPDDVLRSALPDRRLPYVVVRRIAGLGSLGRRRFVALADWRGSLIAREAKALVPSASAWANGARYSATATDSRWLLQHAVRVPDPCFSIRKGWIVRRLGPDCCRIDLGDLPRKRHEKQLLRGMGWEAANLHLGTTGAAARILHDLQRRPRRWLQRAAEAMATATYDDWRTWSRER
jgi:uncharacterized protein (DUF2252 family)